MTENHNPITADNITAKERYFLDWYRSLNDDQRRAVNTSLETGEPFSEDIVTTMPPEMFTDEQRRDILAQMTPNELNRIEWTLDLWTSEGEKLPESIIHTAHIQDQLRTSEIMALRIVGDMAMNFAFTRTALFEEGNLEALVNSISRSIQDTAAHFSIPLE